MENIKTIKEYIEIGKDRSGNNSPIFKLYYESYGEIEAPIKIIFIAGFMSSGKNDYYKQVEYFMKQELVNKCYQIVIFDNRGSGNSGTPNKFSTFDMALDMIELMDHLGWDSAHVIGASMGGMIALELATVIPPQRIRSLTLAVTHAGHTITPIKGTKAVTKSIFTSDPIKKSQITIDSLYSKEYLSKLSIEDPSRSNKDVLTDIFVDRLKTSKKPSLNAIMGHFKSVLTHYISETKLKYISNQEFPIQIITGTNDHLVDPKNSFYLKSKLNPCEFTVFQGCGHAVNTERLNDFNNLIQSHINRFIPDHNILNQYLKK
ncbi:hypothetical protein DDB_G0281917 [Dictyostelium discoideum AX4]|uniref:AB hydrolase-1 domain-containing protein n=1 Tax=Dictyostelium discoideum TaxID=44689 RepID=Q54T91_DICDI|nr:hypothetical protein DDB_G0281917 [Dictyostelium discoideum AX4]EAL66518.1 hypothetical protein DDB_G0281917 [Dictyostelium discoideum AX4]|eukprot:XP_640498.1 hypothetical protein DDB_G0281917 [Dictyostelium discoideum AX4]